jgi:hypothetical protein
MKKNSKTVEIAEDEPLNIAFKLGGEDKQLVLRYVREQKFRKHAPAVYKLAMERLEQIYGGAKAASSVSESG